MNGERGLSRLGFGDLLLAGVIVLTLTCMALGLGLYLVPRAPLTLPELQPAVRVAQAADVPVGGSRIQSWGERIVLVVRRAEDRYFALQGTSPMDGCILRWDPEAQRVISPCTYVVYDDDGNVVAGLTTEPLHRYAVFVRDGVIYVTGG